MEWSSEATAQEGIFTNQRVSSDEEIAAMGWLSSTVRKPLSRVLVSLSRVKARVVNDQSKREAIEACEVEVRDALDACEEMAKICAKIHR